MPGTIITTLHIPAHFICTVTRFRRCMISIGLRFARREAQAQRGTGHTLGELGLQGYTSIQHGLGWEGTRSDSTPDCEQHQFISIMPQWQLTLHSVDGRLCCLVLFNPYNTSAILAIILTNKWGSPVYNPHKVTEPSNWGASPSTDFSHCGVYGSVFFLGRVKSPWKRF